MKKLLPVAIVFCTAALYAQNKLNTPTGNQTVVNVQYKDRIEKLEKENAELRKIVNNLLGDMKEMQTKVVGIKLESMAHNGNIKSLTTEMGKLKNRQETTTGEFTTLKTTYTNYQTGMNSRIETLEKNTAAATTQATQVQNNLDGFINNRYMKHVHVLNSFGLYNTKLGDFGPVPVPWINQSQVASGNWKNTTTPVE